MPLPSSPHLPVSGDSLSTIVTHYMPFSLLHRQQHKITTRLTLSAVVTGASEGIGKEFALQLAKKGFNIVVSARNAAALDALVAEIG